MRPRRAFRPTGDALEARRVPSSFGVRHAVHPHPHPHPHAHAPAHVRHAHAAAPGQGATSASLALVNLFPIAGGTTFVSTSRVGPLTTAAVTNVVPSGLYPFGAAGTSTVFAQTGPGFAVVSALPASTGPAGSLGVGGDLNGLVLFGGPNGTPGGDLNGLVIF